MEEKNKSETFNSTYEGWAKILEKLEDLGMAVGAIGKAHAELWDNIKENLARAQINEAEKIYSATVKVSCEATKIATMARAYIDMVKEQK